MRVDEMESLSLPVGSAEPVAPLDSGAGGSEPAVAAVTQPAKRPGGNRGGGKPFSRLERIQRERAEAEEQRRRDETTRREQRLAREQRIADNRAAKAARAAAPRPDPEPLPESEHGIAFGVARKRLARKARALGLNLQTIKGLRPISEAASLVGKKRFLEAIYLAVVNGDPAALAWWKAYEGLDEYSRQLQQLIFDEVALSAGVRPDELLKAVVGAAVTLGSRTNELVYAMMSPKVVKAMTQSATRIDPLKFSDKVLELGQRDRQAILQGKGFLTTRGGPSININTNASAAAAAKADAASAEPTVPSFLDDVAALEAPKAAVQQRIQAGVVVGEAAE